MAGDRPSAEAIGQALDRVLSSGVFARSERSRKLLAYLVKREQGGFAGDLKGFSIAMDVFGKDAEFDPSTDAVVRVQAGRLRDLLKGYYAGPGRADPVRIDIPRGGYAPAYRLSECSETASGEDEAAVLNKAATAEPPPAVEVPATYASLLRQMRIVSVAIAAIAAMLGYVVFTTFSGEPASSALSIAAERAIGLTATASEDAIEAQEMRPSVAIATEGDESAVLSVASSLRIGLAGFDTIDLITAPKGEDGDPGASFVFSVMGGTLPGEVLVELRDHPNGRVVLSRVIRTGEGPDVSDLVAELLTTTVPTSGVLYAYIRENGLESPLTQCMLLNDSYYADQSAARHREAYQCLERLLGDGALSPLVYSELAALQLEAVTDGHPYPKDASAETALAFARRAVALGPTSPYAHRATGFLLSRLGGQDEAIRWMQKAYELNRYDLSMAASYAYSLIKAGRYAEGTTIMHRAVAVSSARPSWWDYTLFLGAFMQGEMDSAADATGALALTSSSHYLAARLIAARHAGREREADELIREIARDFPKFAVDPRAHFEEANYPADLTDRLVDALQAAGLRG